MNPARMCLESLDRKPGIREQPGSKAAAPGPLDLVPLHPRQPTFSSRSRAVLVRAQERKSPSGHVSLGPRELQLAHFRYPLTWPRGWGIPCRHFTP
jgi:hypothetical protein